MVAAELADGLDEACEKLESALKASPRDSGLHYDAACAYALASRALSKAANPAKSQEQAARAIGLLQEAIRARLLRLRSHSRGCRPRPDPRPSGIRRDHECGSHAIAAMRPSGAAMPASRRSPVYGLDPAAHEAQGRKLIAQGFRPVSVSVTRTFRTGRS